MKIVVLNTPVSGNWHRDSDLLSLSGKLSDIELVIEKDSDASIWSIMFTDTTAYRVTSEEFSTTGLLGRLPVTGGFFEVIESPWIAELSHGGSENIEGSRHFIYCCYDEVIEIIATDFRYTRRQAAIS